MACSHPTRTRWPPHNDSCSPSNAGGASRSFDFVHVLLPHWPWRYVRTLQDNGEGRALHGLLRTTWNSDWATLTATSDTCSRCRRRTPSSAKSWPASRRLGQWDDSVVVVTADHGAGFVPGQPWRGLSNANVSDVAWTPLFIKLPGQTAGKIDDRPARTVDILPTVADVLDVKIPWKVAGRSLLGAPRPDGPFKVLRWDLDGNIKHAGRFNIVDGPAGFANVLKAKAVPAQGDPSLAIYRVGPFGGLVGRPAAEVPVDSGAPDLAVTVNDPQKFDAVDPGGLLAPFLQVSGTSAPRRAGVSVAIVVNGAIAATTETVDARPGIDSWWASLPPAMFRKGANDVRIFEILGTPDAPRFRPLSSAPSSTG